MNDRSNVSAKYYDEVYAEHISQEKTEAELKLISRLCSPQDKILDVGCGTGRHLIPLHQAGYQILGLDTSQKMLDQLQSKKTGAKVINANFLEHKFDHKFDLITLMWNVVNESVLTEAELDQLMERLAKLLKPNGKALLNLSYEEDMETDGLDFYFETRGDKNSYQVNWKILNYDPDTKTTHSQEHIKVLDDQDQVVDSCLRLLTQRWWSLVQIEEATQAHKLDPLRVYLADYKDTYLILQPKGGVS